MSTAVIEPHRLWQRAQEVFEAVVDLPTAEQGQRVAELAEGDDDLAATVHDLLAADRADAASPLDATAWPASLNLLAAAHRRGESFGPYRLGELLGIGGMGEVYAAERIDGEYQQQVAIKLLPAVARDSAARRFRRERQILASLTHPNIAMLLDGGMVSGRPYLVMERVDGQSIVEYCRTRRCTVEQCVELLRRVVSAVAYAHRHRVVHRDLKPQNILVTAEGHPKLLDFGIAELLLDDTFEGSVVEGSAAGTQRLSPGYCAPEQLAGETAGKPSDIFSLGVLLVELLTGRRPFQGQEKAPDTLLQAMVLGARKMVELLPDSRSELEELAGLRRTTPRRYRRLLGGDLQAICDRALESDPDRRYASADDMADDLGRWLEQRPLLAGPSGVGYRLRTWLRRRAAWAVAAGVVALALLLLVASHWARQQERVSQAVVTENLTQRAEGSVDVLLDVVRLTDPAERSGRPLTSQEVLARSEERARSQWAEDPKAQSRVLAALADSHRELGDLTSAGQLAAEALELRRGLVTGAEPVDDLLATGLDQLSEIRRLQGNFEEAEQLSRQALEMWRKHGAASPQSLARSLDNQAEILHELGRYEAAEPLYRESLDLRRSSLGEDHPLTAESQAHYALLLKNMGRPQEALDLHMSVLASRRRLLPPEHPDIAESLYQVGSVKAVVGRQQEALQDLELALELHQEAYGDSHPKTLLVGNDLGLLLFELGEIDSAEPMLRRVLAGRQALYGEPHPELAQSYTALSSLLYDRGELNEAKEMLQQSVAINRSLFGGDHPYVLSDLLSLAHFEKVLGRPESAVELQRQALDGFLRVLDPTHREVCRARVVLGETLSELGRAEGRELLRRGRDCFESSLGREHPASQWARDKLARHQDG